MGYCINIELKAVRIPADKVEGALEAINALHTDEMLMKKADGGLFDKSQKGKPVRKIRWYSWVGNPKGDGGFSDLQKAFSSWRYRANVTDEGDVELECFTGEKWGNDPILFEAIAPFVSEGAEIHVRGEDGIKWSYSFNGKECVRNSSLGTREDWAIT
jgi:hypothetical protein